MIPKAKPVRSPKTGGGAQTASVHALSALSDHQERVNALLGLGLSPEELASACDVAAGTIRNWREGKVAPRIDAARLVDDLRLTVLILTEAGLADSETVQWLRSRNQDLGHQRPLDLVRHDPLAVLEAAETTRLDAVLP